MSPLCGVVASQVVPGVEPARVYMVTDTSASIVSLMNGPGGWIDLPSIAELFGAQGVPLGVLAGGLGDALWVVTYVMAIVIGFRRKTYAVPLLAVCLNLSWEFYFVVVNPPVAALERSIHTLWLLVDLVILGQVFRYGRAEQPIDLMKRHFPLVVLATLGIALAGEMTAHAFSMSNSVFSDTKGAGMAYLLNLVMSVLFVLMYFGRPDRRGLSLGVAWTKLLGTGLVSLGNVVVFNAARRTSPEEFEVAFHDLKLMYWAKIPVTVGAHSLDLSYYYFLFATVLLFDALYVALLHRDRREVRAAG